MSRGWQRAAQFGFRPSFSLWGLRGSVQGGKACPSFCLSTAPQCEDGAYFQSSEVVIISPRRHVCPRARPRDASGSVSRDLRTLAGPCWQSGCAGWRSPGFRGPGTSNSFPEGKLSGRGRGACPGAGSLCARASLSPAAVQPGCPAPRSSRPRAPATCRELPRLLPLARPPAASTPRPPPPPSAEVPDSFCPVTLSPDSFTFQPPVAAVSFPSLRTERLASLVSGRHLTTHFC